MPRNAKQSGEHERGSIADRTPFHVDDDEFKAWVNDHFPLATAADLEEFKQKLKRKDAELKQRFEKAGWQFED
jgi:hypothetical protein